MDVTPTDIDKYKNSRLKGVGRCRISRDSRADRECSLLRSRKNPRTPESYDHDRRRKRQNISEDQCISLFPSAENHSKENISKSRTSQFSRNRWSENRKTALADSTHSQEMHLDLSKEFPPLGATDFSTTPEVIKDWGSLVEEEEKKAISQQEETNPRPKRKLLLSEAQKQNPSKQKNLPVNEHRLEKRQKQIDFGKNTLAYGRYIAAVKREDRTKDDPNTPNKFQSCSTRSWVGQVKIWRRKLHVWDPPTEGQEDLFFSSSQSSIQLLSSDVKMEVDSNCDADDDMMSTSTPSSVDDLFHGFDIDACLMNDGLPL
ncbi:histone RNA hairpin-binding protein-like isoform X1 [Montipora capricornis]|uniref:histone RNA hairpin-binding protein-like isoform X1 n=1 Tax=Montipora capricornis TaxID=246305 RepID=UPI0035F1A14C